MVQRFVNQGPQSPLRAQPWVKLDLVLPPHVLPIRLFTPQLPLHYLWRLSTLASWSAAVPCRFHIMSLPQLGSPQSQAAARTITGTPVGNSLTRNASGHSAGFPPWPSANSIGASIYRGLPPICFMNTGTPRSWHS